ncbi:MAG: type VI secretion system tip protein TssI/VgrG [Acetobacteraceae bacterium]|nr:type VI secretion system tip protein TssI/VgrG [Acetobacteraceae bacterium]
MSGASGGAAGGKRLLALTTALGDDVLIPVAFRADEAIGEPFTVVVEAVSTEASIDPDTVLYNAACLTVRGDLDDRYFHGLVRAFSGNGRPIRDHWAYTLEIVPRFWFLSQTMDCRIFQNLPVANIVQSICAEIGQTLTLKTYGSTTAKEYVTQYNETDLDFLRRLMEAEGYHFHFEHTNSDHTMVVTDQNSGFPTQPKPTLAVIYEGGNADVLTDWRKSHATTYGQLQLKDYDPAKPGTDLTKQQATTLETSGASKRDVFRWPALSFVSAEITRQAKYMLEAAEAAVSLRDGASQNNLLSAGTRLTVLRDPFNGDEDMDYVVRRITHQGQDNSWVNNAGVATYSNELSALPAATPWREPMTTPRPVMAGVYAAIVLGADGEEIHADSMGRVKVMLFFDHRGDTSSDKAVWARVVQPWAGNTWGWQHLPRVGTEVAVSFMDGDPDRPVVLGGLYNGTMQPVFAVPDEQNKSGLRTRSTKTGDKSTFSELSFDDTKGSELFFAHAEKDMTVEVENDQKIEVKHDQTLTVDNNRTHTVKQKETIEVDDSQTNTIKNGRTTTINASGDKLTVDAGDLTVKVSSGAISMEALQSITLKVGSNTITISQSGIEVKGLQVSIEGSIKTDVKAPMTTVNGDGMLTLKGGITMIN